MDSLLFSTLIVAVAEIGDKTQVLALMLAARFRRPVPIIFGILVATLINHGLAASLGVGVAQWLGAEMLRWILGASFLAMAVWTLIPDSLDDQPRVWDRSGVFLATTVSFFLLEMGDKTQMATVALGARFGDLVPVTLGTTLGMMLADVPAVFVGGAMADRLPMRLVRALAAALFAVVGGLTLAGVVI